MPELRRKPRVLLVLHELSLTGAPKVALDAFEELRGKYNLRILALSGGPLEARCRRLAPTRILMGSQRQTSLSRSLEKKLPRGSLLRARGAALSLSSWLRNFRPDLIYINSAVALHAARYCRFPNAPVLLHVHELDSYLQPIFERFPTLLSQWPNRYIAASDIVRQRMIARFKIQRDKISIIHSFIRAPEAPNEASPPPTPFVIGNAGGLEWRKGVELWLLAAHEVARRHPNVRFVWIGWRDDERGRQCREMTAKLGLEALVEWVPVTLQPLSHLARCHCVCISSWEEPASLVALEAMALQKPVLCFAGSGGPAELVGPTGIVLPQFSASELAEAILQLIVEPQRRLALGRAARQRVLDLFDARIQAPAIARSIQQTIRDFDFHD